MVWNARGVTLGGPFQTGVWNGQGSRRVGREDREGHPAKGSLPDERTGRQPSVKSPLIWSDRRQVSFSSRTLSTSTATSLGMLFIER